MACVSGRDVTDAADVRDVTEARRVARCGVRRPGAGAGATGGAGRPADARNPRRVALAAAGAFVLMAGVLGAFLQTSTPETQTRLATTGADKPIRLGRHPNGITFANGALWVLSNPSPDLVVLDAKTSTERNPPIEIGTGGTAVTAGFGSIWVIKESTGMLIRLTLSGAREGSVPIRATGRPVVVAAGAHAIWVGVRERVGVRENQEVRSATLVKVDPQDPRRQRAILMPDGLQNVAVGAGAAWVTATKGNKVVRIDARNTARRQNIPVGDSPTAVAVGQDAVWVGNSGDDTISRIDPRTRKAKLWVRLDYTPTRLITGASSVWSTAKEANKLIRIDPDEPKILKEIRTGSKPLALEVTDRSTIWLTLLNANSVQRVPFKPRQRALRAR